MDSRRGSLRVAGASESVVLNGLGKPSLNQRRIIGDDTAAAERPTWLLDNRA
jgi:hypothetical protein